jgi:hypothetical protein
MSNCFWGDLLSLSDSQTPRSSVSSWLVAAGGVLGAMRVKISQEAHRERGADPARDGVTPCGQACRVGATRCGAASLSAAALSALVGRREPGSYSPQEGQHGF